jgi:Holliday junction resolvase
MPANNKAKGARSEYKVRDHYEHRGWYVLKAGGSLGMWDLVALHPDYGTELIQVKTNRNPGRVEMDALKNFQCHGSWCKKLVVVRDYHGMTFYDL